MTPSIMVANRMIGAAGTVAQAVNPLSDNITTKRNMKDLLSILPYGNGFGMRNLNDYLSSQFPKSELPQQ